MREGERERKRERYGGRKVWGVIKRTGLSVWVRRNTRVVSQSGWGCTRFGGKRQGWWARLARVGDYGQDWWRWLEGWMNNCGHDGQVNIMVSRLRVTKAGKGTTRMDNVWWWLGRVGMQGMKRWRWRWQGGNNEVSEQYLPVTQWAAKSGAAAALTTTTTTSDAGCYRCLRLNTLRRRHNYCYLLLCHSCYRLCYCFLHCGEGISTRYFSFHA